MRKFIAIALLGALCITMFAGCATSGVLSGNKDRTNVEGSSSDVSTETTSGASLNTEQVTTEMPTTSPVLAEPTTGSSKYKTLNDWYVDNKSDLDKIAYNLSNGTLTCEISCEGIFLHTHTHLCRSLTAARQVRCLKLYLILCQVRSTKISLIMQQDR